jgi:DedD protein
MEKKKAILIAVIAGLFLVIVVAFPLILLSSKNKAASPAVAAGIPQPSAILPQQPASMDINDLVNKNTVSPTIPAQNVIINNYDKKPDTPENSTVRNPDGTITINVLPAPVVAPQTTPAQPASQVKQSPPPQKAPPPSKPAGTAKPATPKSPPAKPADTAKPVAKKPADTPKPAVKPAAPKKQPSSTQVADVDFWVQVGFFSTQAIADNAKAALASKGITAVTQNAFVNGQNGFRVRIGPYTSNDEAGYWLKLIKAMDGFSQSYTLQTKR